jgi:hypothetical protein
MKLEGMRIQWTSWDQSTKDGTVLAMAPNDENDDACFVVLFDDGGFGAPCICNCKLLNN